MQTQNPLLNYARLMRLDKPIGTMLLLWPALWALWLASDGSPDNKILWIFIAGVFLMRSAGCVVNDIADRHVDAHVERTHTRPLAQRVVSVTEAIILAILLAAFAFLLVLQCNTFTILLSFVGAALAVIYPFMKRFTHLPQVGLGAAFAWSIPMAFAAQTNAIANSAWLVFFAAMIWSVIYDTMYAMIDRDDDIKVGIKSTAILMGNWDCILIAILQMVFLILLVIIGFCFHLQIVFYVSLLIVAILFLYQQYLLDQRTKKTYFHAFINNNWVGFTIFIGIYLSFFPGL